MGPTTGFLLRWDPIGASLGLLGTAVVVLGLRGPAAG